MTGSLSARGHVQPIGGVNEKVEGWYDACMKLGGLTGRQGVLIPVQNAGDLVLRPDVAGAIADSQFHVIPVSHRDTAVEYMFNRPAEEVYGKFKSELERYAKEARTQRKEA
jgi:predicted ATP-dependent protease